MYKYLRLLRRKQEECPTWLENTQNKVNPSRSLLKDSLSRPPFSPPQNRSTNQQTNTKLTPHSTPTIPLWSHNLLWLWTEDYLEDLLATFMQNKTYSVLLGYSNTHAVLLAQKTCKLGRREGFRDTFIKAVKSWELSTATNHSSGGHYRTLCTSTARPLGRTKISLCCHSQYENVNYRSKIKTSGSDNYKM